MTLPRAAMEKRIMMESPSSSLKAMVRAMLDGYKTVKPRNLDAVSGSGHAWIWREVRLIALARKRTVHASTGNMPFGDERIAR